MQAFRDSLCPQRVCRNEHQSRPTHSEYAKDGAVFLNSDDLPGSTTTRSHVRHKGQRPTRTTSKNSLCRAHCHVVSCHTGR